MKQIPIHGLLITLLLIANNSARAVDSTISSVLTNRMAYGANVGWVDWHAETTNGVVIGEFVCSGYAYGANIGWINFEPTGNARVDLITGKFSGYAYGANVGWISLSNAQAVVKTDTILGGPDSDLDGISDPWERHYAGDLTSLSGGGHDADGDGVPDTDEYGADTNPFDSSDYLRITALDVSLGDTATITWTSKPSRLYRVQNRLDMQSGTWADNNPPGLVPPDVGLTTTRSVTDAAVTQRFFRVKSLMPLSP